MYNKILTPRFDSLAIRQSPKVKDTQIQGSVYIKMIKKIGVSMKLKFRQQDFEQKRQEKLNMTG